MVSIGLRVRLAAPRLGASILLLGGLLFGCGGGEAGSEGARGGGSQSVDAARWGSTGGGPGGAAGGTAQSAHADSGTVVGGGSDTGDAGTDAASDAAPQGTPPGGDPRTASGGAGGAGSGGGPNVGTARGGRSGEGGTAMHSGGGSASGGSSGAAGYAALADPLPSIDCRKTGDGKTTMTLVNHCSAPIEARGSQWAGKTLGPNAFVCLDLGTDAEPLSALRYWGFLGADPGGEHYTLAEFTLNTDFHDFDWYDISHVDAHNLPMQIVAVGMPSCRTLTCAKSLLADCPDVGKFRDSGGNVVSCVSPDRNNATSPVATYFDQQCADAYSWSGDDAQSMVACAGEDFDVVFCP